MLDCYDLDAGQPRHFPEGTYRAQVATESGRIELDVMRLLRRCWLIFQHKKLDDWSDEDAEFAHWVNNTPIDTTQLNEFILWLWQVG